MTMDVDPGATVHNPSMSDDAGGQLATIVDDEWATHDRFVARDGLISSVVNSRTSIGIAFAFVTVSLQSR
jgi:hypothetical protein